MTVHVTVSFCCHRWMGWGSWCQLAVDNWILLRTPSNQFSLLHSYQWGRDAETGQCTCDEVHRFLSPFQPPDQQFGDIFVYGNIGCGCLKSCPIRHPFSWNGYFPVHPMHRLCVVYESTFMQCVTPPPPIDSAGRICGSVGGFVGLCKRPRKMFSDKLFSIPQSLLGRALHHAAWCITRSRCLFPSLYLSHTHPLFLHLSITLSACPFSLSSSLALTFSIFCYGEIHTPRDGPSSWASCLR